ncbi:MAG: alpha/beta fold hydrolase [Anaerolineae bacterium]|nr:alpha/beta fold hydrolase [Anaerolineae bacterium]
MKNHFLDNPLILTYLFHPRPAAPGTHKRDTIIDGEIWVTKDVSLGYRLHIHQPGAPTILYLHGNGEIAPDYDDVAPLYHKAGASLLVIDYRGYGWSTGSPSTSTLLPDMEAVYEALPEILGEPGLANGPIILMGRSLGSACAIHLASQHPGAFKGLIIESGFANIVPLLARLGIPIIDKVVRSDPINNIGKMSLIPLPLLVIHGEDDTLIPSEEGQALYDTSPAELRTIKRIPGAGHNDLLYYAEEYFAAIADFIKQVAS